MLTEPSAGALARLLAEHGSGVPCVYGGDAVRAPGARFADAARSLAARVVVDGAVEGANVTIVVLSADVGSVRSAAGLLPDGPGRAEVVLNRWERGRVRPRDVARSLGVDRVHRIPEDARWARAADAGRTARRGPATRATRRLADRLLERLA